MNGKIKIAFLFGAGVEGEGNFEIESGYDYMKKSLFPSNSILDALKEKFNETYFDIYNIDKYKYEYTKHKISLTEDKILEEFLKNKCYHDINFFVSHKKQLSYLLDTNLFEECCYLANDEESNNSLNNNEQNGEENNTIYKKDISSKLKNILKGEIKTKSDISNNNSNELLYDLFEEKENGELTINFNLGISGILDSYFHTIIDPRKYGPYNFSKIFNYYWACYFTILESTLKYLLPNNSKFERYFIKDKLNYSYILENLVSLTNELYDPNLETFNDVCYYHFIREYLEKYTETIDCKNIITTNYYNFTSQIQKETIFLNGQLNLFEFPELLEVVDFNNLTINKKFDKLFFPFMFGQSFLKPIVSNYQIEQFNNFSKCLKNIDTLIIMGYNINEDDNHINSFLHNFLEEGKEIIIVSNCKNHNFDKKLKSNSKKLNVCRVNYPDIKTKNNCYDEEKKKKYYAEEHKKIIDQIFKYILKSKNNS